MISKLEDKIKDVEKEKNALWERCHRNDDESLKVDELLYDNDNLKKEIDKMA